VRTDSLHLWPRAGFSWAVSGTGTAAVRASYGIFHGRITSLALRGAVNGYNGLNTQSVDLANPPFFPLVPNAASLPAAAISVSNVPAPKADTPYTQQSSAGFQFAVSPGLAASVDF